MILLSYHWNTLYYVCFLPYYSLIFCAFIIFLFHPLISVTLYQAHIPYPPPSWLSARHLSIPGTVRTTLCESLPFTGQPPYAYVYFTHTKREPTAPLPWLSFLLYPGHSPMACYLHLKKWNLLSNYVFRISLMFCHTLPEHSLTMSEDPDFPFQPYSSPNRYHPKFSVLLQILLYLS